MEALVVWFKVCVMEQWLYWTFALPISFVGAALAVAHMDRREP